MEVSLTSDAPCFDRRASAHELEELLDPKRFSCMDSSFSSVDLKVCFFILVELCEGMGLACFFKTCIIEVAKSV